MSNLPADPQSAPRNVMVAFLDQFIRPDEGEKFHEVPTHMRSDWRTALVWEADGTKFPSIAGYEFIGYIENTAHHEKYGGDYVKWAVCRSGTYPRILKAIDICGETRRELNFDL